MAWDPDTYPATIRAEVHDYEALQERVAAATAGMAPRSVLDLGVGTGETARRILEMHPTARLVGIDSSAEMLRGAAQTLPEERVTLVRQDLAAPLPEQLFDLVVSALAVHHLEGNKKAKLFVDIARHLRPGGCFVMGDVVVPTDPADEIVENEPGYDFPSTVEELLEWLKESGFHSENVWIRRDLAVIKAMLPPA